MPLPLIPKAPAAYIAHTSELGGAVLEQVQEVSEGEPGYVIIQQHGDHLHVYAWSPHLGALQSLLSNN